MERLDDFAISGNPYDLSEARIIQREGKWLILSSDGHVVSEHTSKEAADADLARLRRGPSSDPA